MFFSILGLELYMTTYFISILSYLWPFLYLSLDISHIYSELTAFSVTNLLHLKSKAWP